MYIPGIYCSNFFYTDDAFKEKYILSLCVIPRVSFCVLLCTNIYIYIPDKSVSRSVKTTIKKIIRLMHFRTDISDISNFQYYSGQIEWTVCTLGHGDASTQLLL